MAKGTISKYNAVAKRSSSGSSIAGQLFLNQMLKNPNYITKITLPGSMGVVTGFCEGPFSFSAGADWKPIVDLGSLEDTLAAGYAILSALGNQAMDSTVSQKSFKMVRGTEMRYAGSGTPTFQFKLILPSYDPNASLRPIEAVKLLMKCVLPEYEDTWSGLQLLSAPLGYGIKTAALQQQDTPFNTVTVSRGKFFKAPNMLVKNVSTEFSQECLEDGNPLYINVNIEVIPWRCVNYGEAMNWLRG